MVIVTIFMLENGRMAISTMSVAVLMEIITLFMAENGRMAIRRIAASGSDMPMRRPIAKELSTNNCCKFMAIFIVFPGFCLKQLQQLFSDNS